MSKGLSKKRVGGVSILLVGLLVDGFSVWPNSHFWALLVFAAGISAIALNDGDLSKSLERSICIGAVILSTAIYVIVGPINPPPQIGWLQPAGDTTPPNGCDDMLPLLRSPSSSEAILVIFGDNGIIRDMPGKFVALRVGECDVVALEPGPNGALVDADIYDRSGTILGSIRNNKYDFPDKSHLTIEKDGLSTLVVHNGAGDELLYVRYLNPNTFTIRGMFACPIPHVTTALITNTSIAGARISHSCGVDNAKGFWVH